MDGEIDGLVVKSTVVLLEDQDSILSTCMVLTTMCNSSSGGSSTLFWALWAGTRHAHRWCADKHAGKITHTE